MRRGMNPRPTDFSVPNHPQEGLLLRRRAGVYPPPRGVPAWARQGMNPRPTPWWLCLALGALLFPAAALGQARLMDFKFWNKFPSRVQLEAELLRTEEDGKKVILSDKVHLWGDELDVHADELTVWPEQKRAVFSGAVRVAEGATVLLCERLELTEEASAALIQGAVLMVKKEATPEQLRSCKTALESMRCGWNALTLQGERVEKEEKRLFLDAARLTACDCKGEQPSWEIRAWKADIIPEERAWLVFPVFYAKGLPVFALPVGYLPLSDRRTGFLFPLFSYSALGGFVLSDSFFLTLGESADSTFSLDWFELRGFRERLELRVRPSARSTLEVRGSFIDDALKAGAKDQAIRALRKRFSTELKGSWTGLQQTSSRAAVFLFSDSDLSREFGSDIAGRALDMAPSSFVLDKRTASTLSTLDVKYRQDLRPAHVDLFTLGPRDSVNRLVTEDTIHRAGALAFHLLPLRWGRRFPLEISGWSELSNQSSVGRAWQDWGMDGTPDPLEPPFEGSRPEDPAGDNGAGEEGDGQLSAGELRRALRLSLQLDLRAPLALGRSAWLEPRISHRQHAYLPHGPAAPDPSTWGLTIGELGLGTALSRCFGGERLRLGHVVQPWMRLQQLWRGASSAAAHPYFDAADRLQLSRDVTLLLFGVDQDLYSGGVQGWERRLRLGLRQGVDLGRGSIAQTEAELRLFYPFLQIGSWVSLDPAIAEVAEADASLKLSDRRNDTLTLGYHYLLSRPDEKGRPLPHAERMQREEEVLFGLEPASYRGYGDTIHMIAGGVGINAGFGFNLGAGGSIDLYARTPLWIAGSLAYQSKCRCFGFSLTVRKLTGIPRPDVFFLLDLAMLGSTAVGSSNFF